ncbi:MAG: glycosyltransferase family 4 protein [Erysipelotrichaceae bacterium]|nr:glycosyltransferase family 4 protein [Erysipelotrichaceae bacterium]
MKILIVSHEFPPVGGGGANACYFLSREFVKMGHEIEIVTVDFNDLPEEENNNGVLIRRVKAKRKHKEHCSFMEMLDFLVKATPLCMKLHKENSYDICLTFFGIPSGPIGYLLKKRYNLPYIIRFGGGDVPGFQDRFTTVYKILGPAIKTIWRNADSLVANSEGLRKMALDYYSKKDFEVIYNGVDTDYYRPSEDKNSEDINILFVSRLIERKGLKFIIPEVKRILENTTKKIRFTVVGDGPYRETLENMVKENELEDYFFFEGQKNREEILPYYQDGDIFILPSKKEGMPNVVLEAMACGLPVIISPCQGAPELVSDNGYICETDGFADKIIELINDDSKRREMGKKSKERIDNLFGWNRTASSYIEIMNRILDKQDV